MIRISEVFGSNEKVSKKRKFKLAFILTGLLSLIIGLVTVYGTYTGTFVIAVKKDLEKKGLAISESRDFKTESSQLRITPLNNVEDTMEELVMTFLEKAENTDGQYYEEFQNFLAYTFYIKNTGVETININYKVSLVDEYKNVGKATRVKIRNYHLNDNDEFELHSDTTYKKETSNQLVDENLMIFEPGEIQKFTFFVWLDGSDTDETMLGGSVKFSWVFSITNAKSGEEL